MWALASVIRSACAKRCASSRHQHAQDTRGSRGCRIHCRCWFRDHWADRGAIVSVFSGIGDCPWLRNSIRTVLGSSLATGQKCHSFHRSQEVAASHVQCALHMNRAIFAIAFLCFLVRIPAHAAPSQREQQLFDLVNHECEKAVLNKLEWNDQLAEAALAHSKLLAEHQDLSHQFPGEPILQERVGATKLRFNAVAENVAEAPDVDTAHTALMKSPGHRANILHQDYNAIGISIVERDHELFVTQDFAHTLVSYTEKQFRDAIVSGFNRARRARGLRPVDIIVDPQLKKAACAQDINTRRLIQNIPGATGLLVFSQSEIGALPDNLKKFTADKAVERMNIGVCLQTGGKTGFSKFWVVAAFF